MSSQLDSGSTSWLLTSTALVLLMTPALSLFYGAFMSRRKVLDTMMFSWASFSLLSVVWPLLTYSLAFSTTTGNSVMGGAGFGLFDSADRLRPGTQVPEHAFCAFQLAFAVVTSAVVSGSVAGRITLTSWSAFSILWHFLCYVPLARWVFYPGGWLAQRGLLDFAGGTVVEANSGVSGLVLGLLVGLQERRRRGAKGGGQLLVGDGDESGSVSSDADAAHPHSHAPRPFSVPLIVLSAGLLHLGWMGFNGGSAISAGYGASRAFLNTHLSAASGILGWCVSEVVWGGRGGSFIKLSTWGKGKVTAVGAATGTIVGLVAITPACGFISPMCALILGFVAAVSAFHMERAVHPLTGGADVLNVFAGHGWPGIVGTLAIGVMAREGEEAPVDASASLFGTQALGVLVTLAVATVGTTVSWGVVVLGFKALGWDTLVGGEREEEGKGEDYGFSA